MATMYHTTNIIGRSSGRSAVGSMAYRRSAKMKSVAHVAYQRGEIIIEEGTEIVHDYRAKGGVVHSEIMLPKNAPREFLDSETLWNAVENRERRKDAQLAREIVVALQREFTLQENIALLREYIKDNFVVLGMVVDFSIHDTGKGNPHAHIMLTMRDVSREGFGNKNRDWNLKVVLLEWRESWADVNNRMFKRKGLDARLDHRSYHEQGLDREPMVHMGHKAWALEKKGVKTDRGNYNREVQRRNAEREGREIVHESSEDEGGEAPPERQKDPREGREAEKTRVLLECLRKQREDAENGQGAKDIKGLLKDKKAAQTVENVVADMREQQRIAKLEKERHTPQGDDSGDMQGLALLRVRAKEISKHIEVIERWQGEAADLQEFRQDLYFWNVGQKNAVDEKIRQAEQEITQAQDFFKKCFHIDYSQAHAELRRVHEEIRRIERKRIRADQMHEIAENQEAVQAALCSAAETKSCRKRRVEIGKTSRINP